MLESPQRPTPKTFWPALALTCWFGLTQSRTAAAQVHWGVHIGGGIEGGTISNEPRPDGIVEAGTIVEYLLPKRNWGFAAIVEQVARQIDGSRTLLGWQPAPRAPTLLLEAYGSWTIGCYSRDAQLDNNEMPTRAIGCGDTLTTAYVLGLRTTATWR